MIDINKKYTFEGEEGKVLMTDRHHKEYPVVWVRDIDGLILTFTSEGWCSDGLTHTRLIEVKPTRWVNLYPNSEHANYHATKEAADRAACSDRIACIEFKEGEGI